MPVCYQHVYTVRTSSPTRLRCRPMAPNFDQKQRRRPTPRQNELVVHITRSRSPSPIRRHPCDHGHGKQRLAVKIYEDRQGNPSPRLQPPQISGRRYTSQTMQRFLQEQPYQHSCHCRIHRLSCHSSPSRYVSKREENKDEEGSVTLEDLVEAAFHACKKARQLNPRFPNAIGAALLCNNGDMFLGCSLGENSNYSSGSAERAILRKALREGHCPPFEALVLTIDASHNPAAFPVPDKECFRLFGLLPIFLVNKNLDIHSTTSAAVRPAAPSSSPSPPKPHRGVAVQAMTSSRSLPTSRHVSPRRAPCGRSPLRKSSMSIPPASTASGPSGWSCAQVLEWLVRVVRLPQYIDDFQRARVDGHTLFHIYDHEKATADRASSQSKAYHRTHQYHAFSHSSSSLEDTLHVYQPAHKKRLLAEIQKLKGGRCVSGPQKQAAPSSLQTPKPEQPRRVVATAEDTRQHEEKAGEDESNDDDIRTLQRRERDIKAAAAAAKVVIQKHERALAYSKNPLKQLSRVKKTFDDSLAAAELGVNEQARLLDGTEVLVGLRTLGCTASQKSIREYFTRRSIGLKCRDVSFYEFLRAVLTLGGVGGWANALPQTTMKASSIGTVKDEGLHSRKTTKKIKTSKSSAALPSKVLLTPPQVSSSSRSSSTYDSFSSSYLSSSCSPSQSSVSSLSGAEEEEEESIKRNKVQTLHFTPPLAPSRPIAAPVVPDTPALLQSVKPPPIPQTAAVTATTPSLVAGTPKALVSPQLPIALPGIESCNDSPTTCPKIQMPLPLSSPSKRVTLNPPLHIVTASPCPTATTMKPVQEEYIPVPATIACPRPPLQPPQNERKEVQSSSLPDSSQENQIPSQSAHCRNSSFSSGGKSSKSSYSPRSPVAQALRRPSPPSIDSLSTSSTVSSIEQKQQQQQPMPSSHAYEDSVIESILSEEDISGLHCPATHLSPNSPSSTTSSSFSSSSPPQLPPPAALLDMGTKIEARYKGRDRWFTGIVARTHQNEHTYDIHYDDGDEETHVPQEMVRPRGASTALQLQRPSSVESSSSVSSVLSLVFQKGDRVEARYQGRGTFYSGVIAAVHASDGSYEIHYDDGDVENQVVAAMVRPVGGKS